MNVMRAASSPMEPLNKNILLAGEVIAEKWKIGEKIGEGTFSQIYSAYSIESRDKVAVKVEAPSSLKPVLEWESLILKSLQDCPYVCRYYYHGKHGDSTVLVMELLGDSMSMLRMSPDSIHGVPLAKAVSVGLEMLDCIEAFHRHGYVHRDIKASNFALSAIPERNPAKQQRYYIIDFGLSRQHLGEDRQVLPARQVAEFRGTSMYASLSSHRRQELGPKDDLWSWFYLVMDFLRGELPWAADAQLKNRQTVLRLKEHYTEKNPSLLVEGLPGAAQLLEMMDYLQSLKYVDFPDYKKIRKQLQAVGEGSLVSDNSDSGDEESSADKKEAQAVAAVSAFKWDAIDSECERALKWAEKAEEQKDSDGASGMLLTIAKRYNTFFDSDGLSFDEQVRVQSAVYGIEKKSRARASFLAPPPIQSFVKRRQSEQKLRSDALRKRRERDFQVRQSLEIKNEQEMALGATTHGSSDAMHGIAGGDGTSEAQNGAKGASLRPLKSESSMEVSDNEDMGSKRPGEGITASTSQRHGSAPDLRPPGAMQQPHVMPPPPPRPPMRQWNQSSNHGGPVPPPPPPPAQRSGAYGHPPPPPPPVANRHPTNGGIPPPPPGFPPNGIHHGVPPHPPPPPPPHNGNLEHRYASAPDRHYGTPVEAGEGSMHRFQKSPRESHGSGSGPYYAPETGEDRGYVPQRPQKSPRDPVPERRYDSPRETGEGRGYIDYQRPRNSSREHPSVPDQHYDGRMETREDHGYSSYRRAQKSPRESSTLVADRHYDAPTETREDRGYGYQQPQKSQGPPRESHGQYSAKELRGRQEKELYFEGKRPRSRSRSSRRGESRSRRRSYSRSSSRSRSRSYSRSASRSPSPPSHSHRRSSHDYVDRHRGSRKVEPKREYSRRQRSRSCSSSRSRSRSSSRSPSPSPPTKRYRRRPSDPSHSRSSHRHSSHSTLRQRSHSKDYPEEYSKSYSKEYPKEYVKGYPKEYVKDYPKEYVKEYPKEYVKAYAKKHPSKEYPSKEYTKEYRRRSPSPDRRHSRSREPQYRRSPGPDRHRSHSRDFGPDDGSWGVDIRFKPASTPEKHRRSSRWQPRS
ncbi:Tau-tubulin kinase 2 [Phytophthora pseudosyringae]|uniref:Casein kinase I n=1 Tax=Phytophthora pseudosyringae TaxID=221518 RepID=A0A8T1VFQ0_9STRA|nr:Tau-tubulin kinase 2 [Phytophthora pseudosyringae]